MLSLPAPKARAAILCVAFLLLAVCAHGQPANDLELQSVANRVMELTNEQRRRIGLKPVSRVIYLEQAAQGHSTEMLDLNYFSHYSPTAGLRDARSRIASKGGWDTLTGENIYRCTSSDANIVADRAVAQWLRSSAHYKVLMNPDYNSIGVGVARRGDEYVITQDFSRQSIEVLSFTATGGANPEVVLQGRILEGYGEGALFANNVLKSQFRADSDGVFTITASVPARSVLYVSLKVGSTRFASKLAIPLDAAKSH